LQYWGRSNTHQQRFAIGLRFGQKFFNVAFCSYLHLQFFNWAAVPGRRFSNSPTSQSPIVSRHLTATMHSSNEILNLTVSYQANTWSDISFEPTIESVLNEIKSDKYKTQINGLRKKLENGDKDYYDNYKKQLPAVTFSACFNKKRLNENIKNYNSLIVIDIDKLDIDKIKENYNHLLNDEYVFSFWRSPSNKGFKGLVSIEFKVENLELDHMHKSAFKKLADYFLKKYGIILDKSGSDIPRLCFQSYDTDLIIKHTYKKFIVESEDIITTTKNKKGEKTKLKFSSNKDALYNPLGKNCQSDRKIMTDIIRKLSSQNLSITYTYEEWCKVAMAISNTFTYEIGLNYFLKLSKLDSTKYDEIICSNFLSNCYETRKGNVNFSSVIYLANQKNYQTKNQKNGVPKAEV
jgi:VirE N-terminal domain/Primase C terminal 2 (PriCT-2)